MAGSQSLRRRGGPSHAGCRAVEPQRTSRHPDGERRHGDRSETTAPSPSVASDVSPRCHSRNRSLAVHPGEDPQRESPPPGCRPAGIGRHRVGRVRSTRPPARGPAQSRRMLEVAPAEERGVLENRRGLPAADRRRRRPGAGAHQKDPALGDLPDVDFIHQNEESPLLRSHPRSPRTHGPRPEMLAARMFGTTPPTPACGRSAVDDQRLGEGAEEAAHGGGRRWRARTRAAVGPCIPQRGTGPATDPDEATRGPSGRFRRLVQRGAPDRSTPPHSSTSPWGDRSSRRPSIRGAGGDHQLLAEQGATRPPRSPITSDRQGPQTPRKASPKGRNCARGGRQPGKASNGHETRAWQDHAAAPLAARPRTIGAEGPGDDRVQPGPIAVPDETRGARSKQRQRRRRGIRPASTDRRALLCPCCTYNVLHDRRTRIRVRACPWPGHGSGARLRLNLPGWP